MRFVIQEAFFGRFLLDKCKTSGPEDFEQMSDDDKDDFARISNLVTSKTVVKSDDPFEFSDSPPSVDRVPGGGYRSEGQSSNSAPWLIQQHQQLSQPHQLHLAAVSSSESVVSTSLPSNQIELQQQHQDDDSDKDHDIGIGFGSCICSRPKYQFPPVNKSHLFYAKYRRSVLYMSCTRHLLVL